MDALLPCVPKEVRDAVAMRIAQMGATDHGWPIADTLDRMPPGSADWYRRVADMALRAVPAPVAPFATSPAGEVTEAKQTWVDGVRTHVGSSIWNAYARAHASEASGLGVSEKLLAAVAEIERLHATLSRAQPSDAGRTGAEAVRLREALREVRRAIAEADPSVLTDTLWTAAACPETVVDRIDAALTLPPSAEPAGWRDIASAPKDGTYVLTWNPLWPRPIIASVRSAGHPRMDPTHWMPLPTPPADGVPE